MNDLLSPHAIEKLVLLFVWIAFGFLFWLFEGVWRNDKRWIVPIIFVPPLVLGYIIKFWDETRSRLFFIGLYIVTLTLLSGVTGYNFIYRLGVIMLQVFLWPYYVYQLFLG